MAALFSYLTAIVATAAEAKSGSIFCESCLVAEVEKKFNETDPDHVTICNT